MKTRLIALDYLRVFVTILVIAVHADSITISPSNYLGGISWWLATSLNTLGRIAVPLFVMMSGALVYRTDQGLSFVSVCKRSWRRIIVPGSIWITLYFIWQNRWHGDGLQASYIFSQLWHSSFGYLHYLFIVLGLYLATPALRRISLKWRSSIAWGGLIGMVIFEYIRYTGTGWAWTGDTPWLWVSYIPYYLLGSLILDLKPTRYLTLGVISLSAASLTLAIISTYYANLGTVTGHPVWWMGQGVNYLWGHFSPTDAIVAVSTYYLFTQYLSRGIHARLDKVMITLGGATYGIYLAHVMVMDAIEYYGNLAIQQITHDLWFYYIEKITLIFVFSYLLVILIRLLKLNHLILGET